MRQYKSREKISCPYCLDGNSKKKRAYKLTYSHENVIFKCFNCGESKHYADMLKDNIDKSEWRRWMNDHPHAYDSMVKQVEKQCRSNSEDTKKRFNANLN